MRIIDSHFHWWPRSVQERLLRRTTYPRAEVNSKGGYTFLRQEHADYMLSSWTEWYDQAIPRAEHLYDIYLKERAAEEGKP